MRQADVHRLSNLSISKNSRDFLVMHFLIPELKSAIRDYATRHVLDVGCGNKPYESLFEGLTDSYVGCDVIQSDGHKVDVICPATQLAFEDDQFDTVFSTQVIEHVDDPFKMLSECFRVLKKGGYLILSAPFTWELHEEPYDFYRFTKYGLKSMLEKHGFDVIYVNPNGGKWAAVFQLNINMIYSSFKKKSFFSKILKGFFVQLRFTSFLNSFAIWADKKYFDSLLTLNYVAVATKSRN
jgi:SAM-dependent methyltransferase